MYKRMLWFACLVLSLSCLGCDKDPFQPSQRKPGSPAGIAPTGGLDELSQPVKTPAPAAPATPPAPTAPATPPAATPSTPATPATPETPATPPPAAPGA
jgi:hypothetical protein